MKIKFWSKSSQKVRLYYYTASTCRCEDCLGFEKYETVPLEGDIIVEGGATLKNGTFGYMSFETEGSQFTFDVCPKLIICLHVGQGSGPLKMNSGIFKSPSSLEQGGMVFVTGEQDKFSVSYGPVSGKTVARELVDAVKVIKEQKDLINRLNKRVHSNERHNSNIQTANNFISLLANFENLAFKTERDFFS